MEALRSVTADQIKVTELAGETIEAKLIAAPAGGAPFGGIKLSTPSGWFAARPSGTEAIYKVYAESFRSAKHLHEIQTDARAIVERIFQEAARRRCKGAVA
jgi:phosphoglucomutase